MAQFIVRRRRELLHAHVARIERGDQSLDRAALAGRVPALEDREQRRAEPLVTGQPAEHEPELQQAGLRRLELLSLFVAAELQVQIQIVQAAHN